MFPACISVISYIHSTQLPTHNGQSAIFNRPSIFSECTQSEYSSTAIISVGYHQTATHLFYVDSSSSGAYNTLSRSVSSSKLESGRSKRCVSDSHVWAIYSFVSFRKTNYSSFHGTYILTPLHTFPCADHDIGVEILHISKNKLRGATHDYTCIERPRLR